jgi:hypothetical protein
MATELTEKPTCDPNCDLPACSACPAEDTRSDAEVQESINATADRLHVREMDTLRDLAEAGRNPYGEVTLKFVDAAYALVRALFNDSTVLASMMPETHRLYAEAWREAGMPV